MRRALLLLALLAACSEPGDRTEVLVFAATSLRDALGELETAYETRVPADLVFNFGSSSDLSRQIVAAGAADLFLSADEKEMDKVEQAGLLQPGSRRTLLSNQLVVIESIDPAAPAASPFTAPFDARQLTGVPRLSLANVESVPAGRYAKAWLESQDAWEGVAANVVPAVDVRAALAAVESGVASAGIVYRTDAALSDEVRVVHVVPLEEGPLIRYPVAVLANGPERTEAAAFATFLGEPEARAVFERFGFIVLGAE